MAQFVTIVGGLPGDPEREAILARLRDRSGECVEWEWIQGDAASDYRPPTKLVRKLLSRLQQEQARGDNPSRSQTKVVKLALLHGQVQNQIHKACEPVPAPKGMSVDEFIDWLLSPEANLVPHREWYGNVREAAFVAILSKLIRNKSWNNSTQGHAWTKEADLMGQAPVLRNEFQVIADEAMRMLGRLHGSLLLSKGGTPGTPKEWSIRLTYVPMVKRIVLDQSFDGLGQFDELHALLKHVVADVERRYRLDGEIVSERVRETCRSQH